MMFISATAAALFAASSVSAFTVGPAQHHTISSAFSSRRATSLASSAAVDSPPPLSPKTSWGDAISDIRQAQQELKRQDLPEFAPTISAVKDLGLASDNTSAQLEYVKKHAMELKQKMEDHGAIIFRDFDLMKTQDGFQEFYKALGMKPCLDPLHSVSARPTVDGTKNSPVYEAVNKESRKNFFIGECIYHTLFLLRVAYSPRRDGEGRSPRPDSTAHFCTLPPLLP